MRTCILLWCFALLTAGEAAPIARLPLASLGVEAGVTVAVDEAEVVAEAAGLPVPLGHPSRLAWTSQQRKLRHVVTAVDASCGDRTPAWAADEPRQEGGGWVVVGSASSRTVAMAYDRAMMKARVAAAQSGNSTTTVTEGPGERTVRQTTNSQVTGGAPRDVVILVPVDAAQPVLCWVRLGAKVEAAPAGEMSPAELQAKMDVERAFRDLDQKMKEELKKPEPKDKAP